MSKIDFKHAHHNITRNNPIDEWVFGIFYTQDNFFPDLRSLKFMTVTCDWTNIKIVA